MAVTNYTPGASICKYTYNKLKDVIYLVSKDHLKTVYIDNGEAYIDGLTELPLRLNGFNIALNEEATLDERYKFKKTVTLSMHGYVDSSIFGGRYYVILESFDGTFWMVNTDFPSRLTYTFNLSKDVYQTDFTLSSVSNFPTLRLASEFEAVAPPCLGFNIYGVESLKLLEKELCGINTSNKTVYTYTEKPFQDVEFLGDSCSMQEVFDGEHVSTTIEFDIAFDAYKSSWHYSLLEFLENLYSAIITPKGGDNAFFAGFNFGLEPSFIVQTQSNQGSDIITVRLVEASNYGSTAAVDWDEEQSTETKWAYVKWVDEIKCYECVELGRARYLVQQEVKKNGVPTGNYKVLEGYVSYYQSLGLNVVGTFSDEEIFNDPDCTGELCSVNTNIPTTIIYHNPTCYTYSYSAACDWRVTDLASYMSVTPSTGLAGADYSIVVCNSKEPTSTETSTFMIKAGTNRKIVNVILTTESGILIPLTQYINCLQQNVTFTYDANCPITVTSIDPRLTYQINNSQLTVQVPRNYSIESGITWDITVRDCNNATETAHIIQDKTYEKWVDTSGYICESGTSYVKQDRYTGTTAEDINTPTGESRKGGLIQTGDTRCQKTVYRWRFDGKYYCIDGDKYEAQEEEVSADNGDTWSKTGNARPGTMVESSSTFCEETVQYKWELTDKWQCQAMKIITVSNNNATNYVVCNNDSTLQWHEINSADTRSAITSVEVGDCVTALSSSCFGNMPSLTSVTIPNTVTKIGSMTFINDTALSSITIPNSVETSYYSSYTFSGCTALSEVQLSTSMSAISIGMFIECYSLTGLTIPNSVTIIYGNAFLNSGLKNIVIPDSVTEFNTYGHFNYCSGLTSITLSNSITSIPDWCFSRCTSLPSITIPTGVTSIGDLAFSSCFTLTGITIPDSVTSIGQQAFQGCTGMTSVTIGTGITEIKAYAFSGCTSLTNITINSITPPTLGSSAFSDTNGCPIYVPAESVQTYKNAGGNWVYLSNRIQAIP